MQYILLKQFGLFIDVPSNNMAGILLEQIFVNDQKMPTYHDLILDSYSAVQDGVYWQQQFACLLLFCLVKTKQR